MTHEVVTAARDGVGLDGVGQRGTSVVDAFGVDAHSVGAARGVAGATMAVIGPEVDALVTTAMRHAKARVDGSTRDAVAVATSSVVGTSATTATAARVGLGEKSAAGKRVSRTRGCERIGFGRARGTERTRGGDDERDGHVSVLKQKRAKNARNRVDRVADIDLDVYQVE